MNEMETGGIPKGNGSGCQGCGCMIMLLGIVFGVIALFLKHV